jgi:hypothetical protein
MARLLRQLNDEAKQPWSVHFHLIYGDGKYPWRSTGACSFGTNLFKVEKQFHEVTSLLIEDATTPVPSTTVDICGVADRCPTTA